MGSYLSDPYSLDHESDTEETSRKRLGDLLSGRLSDVSIDSVDSVRSVRERP